MRYKYEVREATRFQPALQQPAVTGPEDVAALVADVAIEPVEHFVAVFLNTKCRVTGRALVSVGTLNASLVHPREIFLPAIAARAAGVVVVHNHPSGDTRPSAEDVAFTARLVRAGELLGIPIHDHLVVGQGGAWTSIRGTSPETWGERVPFARQGANSGAVFEPAADRWAALYRNASPAMRAEGMRWYRDAREMCERWAQASGHDVATVAGVVAAMSPRCSWPDNCRRAHAAVSGGPIVGLGARSAERIISGAPALQVLKGPKVRAFYRAIMGDERAAVLDVHMLRSGGVRAPGGKVTPLQYRRATRALSRAAGRAGVPVSHFQATVWTAVRTPARAPRAPRQTYGTGFSGHGLMRERALEPRPFCTYRDARGRLRLVTDDAWLVTISDDEALTVRFFQREPRHGCGFWREDWRVPYVWRRGAVGAVS